MHKVSDVQRVFGMNRGRGDKKIAEWGCKGWETVIYTIQEHRQWWQVLVGCWIHSIEIAHCKNCSD